MIVREHSKNFLPDEPGRLAMRKFFPGFRQAETRAPHPFNLFLTFIIFGNHHVREIAKG
jgi:hypothetical protein